MTLTRVIVDSLVSGETVPCHQHQYEREPIRLDDGTGLQMISGFHSGVNKIFALLVCYAAKIGS